MPQSMAMRNQMLYQGKTNKAPKQNSKPSKGKVSLGAALAGKSAKNMAGSYC